jgi:hypothetical protein
MPLNDPVQAYQQQQATNKKESYQQTALLGLAGRAHLARTPEEEAELRARVIRPGRLPGDDLV